MIAVALILGKLQCHTYYYYYKSYILELLKGYQCYSTRTIRITCHVIDIRPSIGPRRLGNLKLLRSYIAYKC